MGIIETMSMAGSTSTLHMGTLLGQGLLTMAQGKAESTDPITAEDIFALKAGLDAMPAYNPLVTQARVDALTRLGDQYGSQAGVILNTARATLEERLTVIKKSLLKKPWLKTQDKRPAAATSAPANKPTPTEPNVPRHDMSGVAYGPENG